MVSAYLTVGLGYGIASWLRDRESLGKMSWKRSVNVAIASLLWPVDAVVWADWVYKWGIRQAIYSFYQTIGRWVENMLP